MQADKSPIFINTRKGSEFSEFVVQDFENGLLRNGFHKEKPPVFPQIWDSLGRIAGKISYSPPRKDDDSGSRLLVGMMGLAERQLYPYVLSKQVVPFIWDCWPNRQRQWLNFFRRHHFPVIAFTTQEAAVFWGPKLPETKVVWLPEAIDVNVFVAGPSLREREATLLEIGRRHERAHDVAKRVLEDLGGGHTYRASSVSEFLPTRYDLISALHNSRALLCYPGSMSDPLGRTGTWESMTHRYLEAAATKTVILGHTPAEMIELFGFDPGLSVAERDLPEALTALHSSCDQFQPLVDRAYNRLLEVATWDVRSNQLKELLSV